MVQINSVNITEDLSNQKPPGVTRVTVAIPNMGYTQSESYCNRLCNFQYLGKKEMEGSLLNLNPRFEFGLAVTGRMFTPVAREEATKLAIEWDSDYLFMIDDDMICPDDLFFKLYQHNVDIVAPLAFTRNFPHKPVMYMAIEGYDSVAKADTFKNTVVMNYPKNQLVECDAVGFGAVLIKRWVLDAVPRPRFMSTCGTGEDIYFCYQAKKIKAQVYMDTSTKIGHLSHPIEITESYVEAIRKQDDNFTKRNPINNGLTKFEPMVLLGE